jgi:aromatic-L-amino-acid/L-tryptophan decarboxylase
MHYPPLNPQTSLDPRDWPSFRAQGHQMLDDMFDYLETIRERPVWQPMPDAVRARFRDRLPMAPAELNAVHEEFLENILPYSNGNVHPGFMGWVHGGGNAVGMLAEMLAAGLNANLGGRDHAPIEVERQIVQWMRQLFGFPAAASGLFVTGTSMANLIAVLVARDAALGFDSRRSGVAANPKRLTAYTSVAAHGSLRRALDFCGLGSDALRLVPVDSAHRINLAALGHMIEADRSAGFTPFLIAGTAGTVDIGAIDDLDGLAVMASEQKMWLHVDGACAALGILAPEIAPRLAGIEAADSLAFDFHKWGQVPYDAGFVMVRDGEQHRKAFASPAAYLERETRGLAAGSPWPCDFGPDLSRGFRALKTWFTLKVYGLRALGEMIAHTCDLARYLEQKIAQSSELELLAPVSINIVCFRYRCPNADRVNARIVVDLQESGVAAPSTTRINGELAIRAAITNHRTERADIDTLVDATLAIGRALTAGIEDPELEAAYRD